jgi:hypothetical protein
MAGIKLSFLLSIIKMSLFFVDFKNKGIPYGQNASKQNYCRKTGFWLKNVFFLSFGNSEFLF